MSSPTNDGLASLGENHDLPPQSNYPMNVRNGAAPPYRDGIEVSTTGRVSPSFHFETPEGRLWHAQEEGLLTARPTPKYSHHDGPKTSTARIFHALYRWIKGPRPPRPFKIRPILPELQNVPPALLQKYFPSQKQKFWLLVMFYFLWLSVSLGVLSISLSGCKVPGYETPVRLSCVSRFWRSSTFCGVNAFNCHPSHNKTFAFRCPADCQGTIISSPETIGDKEYNYRSIVVGGSATATDSSLPIYRGDSFICGAAIHAGVFNNRLGGSGVASLVGERSDFPAIEANGISSLNFAPSFPLSFTLSKDPSGNTARCYDPRWGLLSITVLSTVTISIFTTSPSVFFGSAFVSIYFYVGLASDPPDFGDYMSVVSWAFRGFLPASFVGLVIYHFCIHHSLNHLTAQIEKTFLWLGGCWLGALSNLTFERLPIQRLTPHDLQQQGAILTLTTIVLIVLLIAIFQAWSFRIEGRMPRYLSFYACISLLLLTLMMIPYVNLRIHHYILALILLPGTTLQTRPSLFYQGLLVGLFINGIARWGFDSILQTSTDLFGEDFNSPIPQIAMPSIDSSNNSITFSWSAIKHGYDSMSVLVNDVERFRGSEDRDEHSFMWTRYKEAEPEYFRFAYVKHGLWGESSVGKFTKPGTWESNGTWIPPDPGLAGWLDHVLVDFTA